MALLRRLLLVLALVAGPATAQTFPRFTGLVVDAANVIPDGDEAALTAKLDKLQHDTRRQLVVATVPDLEGYPIEEYGYKLGRNWGVGLRDVNNGAILLVAPNERKVRIEVGYGLEPVLTDALSSTIIRDDITPRFKAGDLPGGIDAGVDAIAKQLRASPEEAKARLDAAAAEFDRTHRRQAAGGGVPVGLIFWGLIFLFVILPMLTGGRRARRWSGGGGGGSNLPIVLWGLGQALDAAGRDRDRGGGSFGGGSFGGDWGGGGGGSDGSWGGGGFTGGGGGSFGGGGASGSW